MFKVTTIINQTHRILALEGSLVGPWLPQLKETWDEERRAHEGAMFVIDLTKVTIVSQHGENVLFQMMTDGARLVGKSLLARVLIQNIERRRNLEHEEREDKATRRASLVVGIVMLLVVAGKLSWASTWRPPQRASNGPAIERLRAGVAADDTALSSILAVTPQIPRGPFDVLNEYEQEMTSIDDRLSRDLAQISESVGLGQISAKESEDLIWERYQIAMMQFQLLSALHSNFATRFGPESACATTSF